ncbi:hypothetical protein K461DRAFT_320074 [Myriangium duriaei CBS 260.36]|uniref:EKC/KEOPS complex subunit CGI121 n=1 Tax=Myriangium duriaei CBS 260.36 TaxID=1168546 RepID=A0A9P4J7I2_9PEZI|nr:hypothetical protein K461DRAFT_320074 [Myriangium duriaei CBS 260.36]
MPGGAHVLETITLPHLEQYPIYVVLFRDVSNSDRLTPTGDQFDYTFIDATMLSTRRQLLDACIKAVSDLAYDRMNPWLVHARIITALACDSGVPTSPEMFGISSATRHIVAVKVAIAPHTESLVVTEDLLWLVHGTPGPLTDAMLAQLRSHDRVSEVNEDGSANLPPIRGHANTQFHATTPWSVTSDISSSTYDQDWILYEQDETSTSMSIWSPGQLTPESLFDDSGYEGSLPDADDLAWHLTLHIAATTLEDPSDNQV